MLAQLVIKQTVTMWFQAQCDLLDILCVEALKQDRDTALGAIREFAESVHEFAEELNYDSLYKLPVEDKSKITDFMETLERLEKTVMGTLTEDEDEDDYWV